MPAASHSSGTAALIADLPGLGKSAQLLGLVGSIARCIDIPALRSRLAVELRSMHAVIVCPAGVVTTWENEIRKWFGEEHGHPFRSYCIENRKISTPETIQKWAEEGPSIFLVGFEALSALLKTQPETFALLTTTASILIVDGAHRLRSGNTMQYVALTRFKTSRRIVLTGTPM